MSRLQTYEQAEQFILSREFFGMKLGLETIRAFLDSIGNPQFRYQTIHVGGTNGKGSTSAMLASIFRAQGYKTGLYTSPHLADFRERIRVDGEKISKAGVRAFADRHYDMLVKKKSRFLN